MNNWDSYPIDAYPVYGAQREDTKGGGEVSIEENVVVTSSSVKRRD